MSAPWLQTKTGCLSLVVCYSVETRLTSQLFLIWFLDVAAFTKEVGCGLLLSETCTAQMGLGPARLVVSQLQACPATEVVKGPTSLSPGRWEHPLISSASGFAAEKQAHVSPSLQPLYCRGRIPGLRPPTLRGRCADPASPSTRRKAQAASAFATIRTRQGSVIFRLTKMCPCSHRWAGRPCTASLLGLCLKDGHLTCPPAGIPLQRLILHLHSASDTLCRASCTSSQTSRASASLPHEQLLPRHPQTGPRPRVSLRWQTSGIGDPQALARCL